MNGSFPGLLLAVAMSAVGCSDRGSQSPATENDVAKDAASSNSRSSVPVAEPSTALPEPGEPGSIKGVVRSPHISAASAVVFVVRVEGRKFQPPEQSAVMGWKNLMFVPHVLPVLVGTNVAFSNSDTVRHTVHTDKGSAQQFSFTFYDIDVAKHVNFDKVGVTQLLCHVHSDERSYVVVCQNPYFAVSDEKANFAIPEVPPGKWRLRLFHEELEPKTIEVVVQPGQETSVTFANLERRQTSPGTEAW